MHANAANRICGKIWIYHILVFHKTTDILADNDPKVVVAATNSALCLIKSEDISFGKPYSVLS